MVTDRTYRQLNIELEEDLESTRRVVARLTDSNHELADKVTAAKAYGGELYTKLAALERLGQHVQLRQPDPVVGILLDGIRELKDEAFERLTGPVEIDLDQFDDEPTLRIQK